jgi:hypothetical protein
MRTADFAGWEDLSNEVLTGLKEWRLQHPKATLREIEAALDERLGGLRARMLQDMALASTATDWVGAKAEEGPVCRKCGARLVSRGRGKRSLQTHGGKEIELERTYGVCPACRAGFFPPR